MVDPLFQTTPDASSSTYVEMSHMDSGSNKNTATTTTNRVNHHNDHNRQHSRNNNTTEDAMASSTISSSATTSLTPEDVFILKKLIAANYPGHNDNNNNPTTNNANNNNSSSYYLNQRIPSVQSNLTVNLNTTMDSDYPEFIESTHAWAVFADDPKKRATELDRLVGTLIIAFQLFTYWLFASEAAQDYNKGQVVVKTRHGDCISSNLEPYENFTCEAEFTNSRDAFVAFFMLGIFLTGDILQAIRVVTTADRTTPTYFFAILVGLEVVAAYVSACIAVSYNLYIGEVTDAVEVGVGLLFIRELGKKAYSGIRWGEHKQYREFFTVLIVLIGFGMSMHPLWEYWFAVKD
jgi:hypothetical protein